MHTTGGELLRCLEGGEGAPGHLALSREGLVVSVYGRGHVAAFTMNGCRLRHQQHTDNIQVREIGVVWYIEAEIGERLGWSTCAHGREGGLWASLVIYKRALQQRLG